MNFHFISTCKRNGHVFEKSVALAEQAWAHLLLFLVELILLICFVQNY